MLMIVEVETTASSLSHLDGLSRVRTSAVPAVDIRTREAHGREFTYIEGWYAISEANRIFGFDGWNRETIESRCALARENRGTFHAVYIARVRVTVQADGATVIRDGHGTGEGRGTFAGEVHDIAVKAAETDATKRALATFGRPFGLELYRGGKATALQKPLPSPSIAAAADDRVGFHPDDTTPIPRPSHYYGRRQDVLAEHFRDERRQAERTMVATSSAPPLAPKAPERTAGRIDKSVLTIGEPKRLWRVRLRGTRIPERRPRPRAPGSGPFRCGDPARA